MVAELVLSIVVDILGHVRIEVVEDGGVERTAPGGQPRKFAGSGLDSAEFGVLQPQVLLDLFDGGQEPENCSVSLVEPAIFGDRGRDVGQQPSADGRSGRGYDSFLDKRAPICSSLRLIQNISHGLSFPLNR